MRWTFSKSTYFEVVDGENKIVKTTSDVGEAILALPVDGEIFDAVKIVVATSREMTVAIVKEIVEIS